MASEPEAPELLAPELMARVRQIQLRTRRLVSDVLAGAYRSTFRGSGIEFDEVRVYQPGDDVRSIDWRRTARGQDAYVKTYVEERELTLSFLVDTSRSMDFGSVEFTKREIAAQFCALLAFVAQRQQDRVGLGLFGKEPGLHLPPRKGSSNVARVVREVIAAQPTAGESDFEAILEHFARTLRRRSLLFLISDFLCDELADESQEPSWRVKLTQLGQRHDVIAVHVSDPLERELPNIGRLQLEDLESGRLLDIDTRSKAVRQAWAEEFAQRRRALAATALRCGIDVIEVSTDANVADPLAAFFRSRGRRRGGAA